jgi:hypothetical protein
LLVHGTSWGEKYNILEAFSGGQHHAKKDNVSRFLGHGVLDTERLIECTAERATLVGFDDVTPGEASLYRVPLPQGLDGVREYGAITVTLAWFSPINPITRAVVWLRSRQAQAATLPFP